MMITIEIDTNELEYLIELVAEARFYGRSVKHLSDAEQGDLLKSLTKQRRE